MLRVYNYMTIGLALTGVVAFATYSLSVSNTPTEYAIGSGLYLTSLGQALFGTPLMWVFVLLRRSAWSSS